MNRVYPGLGTDDSFQLFVSGIAISTDLVNWEDALGHPIGETGGVDEATVSFHSVGSTRYVVQQDRDGEVVQGTSVLERRTHIDLKRSTDQRSKERRVGKECVSTCRYRWAQ